MELSQMMARQVGELQHTLNLNLLSSQMATQTAAVTTMIEDMTQTQKAVQAPHPYLGSRLDVKG
ncbi:polyribonucleotide nucleotidyltransferase [Cytobacillus sp. FJAT-54145]|uniref:Polyribonucleotide nucleotidyltransferase n=1 Tax=Cytobacillus spartinae TaxID=3299023 RepID=A0ABW6KGM4_9BACI